MIATSDPDTGHRPRHAGWWLAGALVALVVGLAVTGFAIAGAQAVDERRRQQCEHLFHRITAAMPGYALPLAVVGAVLVVLAAGLAVVGRRRASRGVRTAAGVLVVLALLGAVFALWLGVYAIHADTPIQPDHCVG